MYKLIFNSLHVQPLLGATTLSDSNAQSTESASYTSPMLTGPSTLPPVNRSSRCTNAGMGGRDAFAPTASSAISGLIPVLLHHLTGPEQLLDLVRHLLVPSQHHDACGFLVQPVAQMQGLCLVAMKHLCQDGEDITDAELDPRAT